MRAVPFLLGFMVMSLGAGAAQAQTTASRASAGGTLGWGQTYDDEGSLGRGAVLGGWIDREIFGTTRVELSLEMHNHHRDITYFTSEGRSIIAGASLVQRFGRKNVQPYLFAGLTGGRHSGTNTYADVTRHVSSSHAGLRFGVGFAIRTGDRYEISPELRMNGFFVDNDSDPVMLPSIAVRFGIRM